MACIHVLHGFNTDWIPSGFHTGGLIVGFRASGVRGSGLWVQDRTVEGPFG